MNEIHYLNWSKIYTIQNNLKILEYNFTPVSETVPGDRMDDNVGYISGQMSNVCLDPPSFRTLYDASSPIIFPTGPVSLHQLLPGAVTSAKTRLADSLHSLVIRGHSLPIVCPPLILLACANLQSFSMSG